MLKQFVAGAAAILASIALVSVIGVGSARAAETVVIKNFAFSPQVLTIHAGTTVVWVNEDSTAHSVIGKQGTFRSPKLVAGAKFSRTFDQAGTFDYACGFHPSMTAKVVVAP
jgi:plastocyanin